VWNGFGGITSTSTFSNHILGDFCLFFLTRTKGFFAFSIVYIINEGVQKSGLVFNLDLKGVC
jgi:hypothetical protein